MKIHERARGLWRAGGPRQFETKPKSQRDGQLEKSKLVIELMKLFVLLVVLRDDAQTIENTLFVHALVAQLPIWDPVYVLRFQHHSIIASSSLFPSTGYL